LKFPHSIKITVERINSDGKVVDTKIYDDGADRFVLVTGQDDSNYNIYHMANKEFMSVAEIMIKTKDVKYY